MYKINHADILDWAKNYDGEPFDGILCDPPYELGFMGKSWDSTGIAFNVELWTELLRICKPGAHLLAFSGSRTYHRMACAIEDAGFEIRDMIEWVYGSGFPKSLNIGKAVDRLQGNEREVLGTKDLKRGSSIADQTTDKSITGWNKPDYPSIVDITKGTSEWEGWGTALKPAHEPCVLARKPIEGTVANNVLEHGTGGLNIDGTRVAATSEKDLKEIRSERPSKTSNANVYSLNHGGLEGMDRSDRQHITGRFPANLIHDGSDEVEAVFPNESSRFFYTAKASRSERSKGLDGTVSIVVQLEQCEKNITSSVKLAQLQVVMDNSHLKATAESGIGTKSGTEWSMSWFGNQYTEKYLTNTKSTTKTTINSITPSIILNYLTGLLTNENTLGANCEMTVGGNHAENAENSNTLTLTINEKTASALGVENVQLPAQLKISVSDGKNFHSTVKPLSLTKYLATLIKPPTGGRLLVPFSGSGSEMIGALQAGWEYVEGVELTEEYIPIAEARIKHWLDKIDKQMEML